MKPTDCKEEVLAITALRGGRGQFVQTSPEKCAVILHFQNGNLLIITRLKARSINQIFHSV